MKETKYMTEGYQCDYCDYAAESCDEVALHEESHCQHKEFTELRAIGNSTKGYCKKCRNLVEIAVIGVDELVETIRALREKLK